MGHINWTYCAENYNNENVILFDDEEPVVKSFILEFERLCHQFRVAKKIKPFELNDKTLLELFNVDKHFFLKELEYQAKYHRKQKDYNFAIETFKLAISLGSKYDLNKFQREIHEEKNGIKKQSIVDVVNNHFNFEALAKNYGKDRRCGKCDGKGYISRFRSTNGGKCFDCGGKGFI